MKYIILTLLSLCLLFQSCKSPGKKRAWGIPRERVGTETIYHLDDIILFYDDARGYFYFDLLYLKNADLFICNFTNKKEPAVVLERGYVSIGDAASDLIKMERLEPKNAKKREKARSRGDATTDKNRKFSLKPVPVENLFKIKKTTLLDILNTGERVYIFLYGRKKENPGEVFEYSMYLDKSDITQIKNFYDSLPGDDKDVSVDDE